MLLSINASIDDTQLKSSKLNLSINGWSTELKAFRAENCLINSCNFGIVDSDNLHISLNHCNIYELGGSGDDGDEYMNSFKGDISNSIIDHLKAVEDPLFRPSRNPDQRADPQDIGSLQSV